MKATGFLFVVLVVLAGCAPGIQEDVPGINIDQVRVRCEAALDEFVQGEGNPPQRVCKEEGGRIRVLTREEMASRVNPGDTIVISLRLAGIAHRAEWRNVFTGEPITKPVEETRLCFVTFPVLMRDNMQGYPNINEAELDRFYKSRPWSYTPSHIFDPSLRGDASTCSVPLLTSQFPEKVSFVVQIPSEEILSLGLVANRIRAYGVKILFVPDRLLAGFTNESFAANYEYLLPIYFLRKGIVDR